MFETVTQKLSGLPKWFRESQVGSALIAEQAAKEFTERAAMIDALALQRDEHMQLLAAEASAIEPLTKTARAALEKYKAAEAARLAMARLHESARYARKRAIERLENTILATASPKIDEAANNLWSTYHRQADTLFKTREYRTGNLDGHGRYEMASVDNKAAIKGLLDAIKSARGALDRLKSENPPDVAAAIAEIIAPVEEAYRVARQEPLVPALTSAA